MIHGYSECYLYNAMDNLGWMLDTGVNLFGYRLDEFYSYFLMSISESFEAGDPALITGHSGYELAVIVLEKVGLTSTVEAKSFSAERSPEYWTGWALCYYQWKSGISFQRINNIVNILSVLDLYHPYHEMDIDQFVDRMNEWIFNPSRPTYLQTIRKSRGYSQSQLAKFSKIPLRTIQQYEQRRKDINMASAQSLNNLSKVLCCRIEDLLENVAPLE